MSHLKYPFLLPSTLTSLQEENSMFSDDIDRMPEQKRGLREMCGDRRKACKVQMRFASIERHALNAQWLREAEEVGDCPLQ
jgi:hypothetical protein